MEQKKYVLRSQKRFAGDTEIYAGGCIVTGNIEHATIFDESKTKTDDYYPKTAYANLTGDAWDFVEVQNV